MLKKIMKLSRLNIAMRIGLLAWLVSVVTLLLFVIITLPQQKSTFISNLQSKANGLAVSLHNVAAGAAINEDYASVVSAAQTMVVGDPDLDFLVVMKNNGFSLIIEQDTWRVEDQVDSYWLDRKRMSSGSIVTAPFFERRVFHFAQPFDYSGIEWGWIHVGLSLQGYDASVSALYRNTLILAIICLIFSLVFSILYARRMVSPVVRLQALVQQIAGGDLSVRADLVRKDEIGSLAESVNTMADALLRRDHILESVRFAAKLFLESSHWENIITDVLNNIGHASAASRATVWRRSKETKDNSCFSMIYEWGLVGNNRKERHYEHQHYCLKDLGLRSWEIRLKENDIVTTVMGEMTDAEHHFLSTLDICSLIIIPVFVENSLWGVLALEECNYERIWTDAEEDSLRTVADMLGATITRQQTQIALLDAKATLEQRVSERTQELQGQVLAKEVALSDLASAQSSLVEMSRAAGMAEVATGVLHNVGNVLNSVNVSCTLLIDQLRDSSVDNVSKLVGIIPESVEELSIFFTEDPRGCQIHSYLSSLADVLHVEHSTMCKETESLNSGIGHIKEIVSMQQNYGKVSGIHDIIEPTQLMEDALNLYSGALLRHNVTVKRKYQEVDYVVVDKHKVLQILLNIINNAKNACVDSGFDEKIITLRIYNSRPNFVSLEVADNGMGIEKENINRIFRHGFTTRENGHGFGLHSGAIAAKELDGSLTVHSNGPGKGATFTLELPLTKEN
ncbi:MAG: HAMP domain-containing protein [Desulfotalea sp.]